MMADVAGRWYCRWSAKGTTNFYVQRTRSRTADVLKLEMWIDRSIREILLAHSLSRMTPHTVGIHRSFLSGIILQKQKKERKKEWKNLTYKYSPRTEKWRPCTYAHLQATSRTGTAHVQKSDSSHADTHTCVRAKLEFLRFPRAITLKVEHK